MVSLKEKFHHRAARRIVALVVYPSVQLLDFAGPADVFALANQFNVDPVFELIIVSGRGGIITTTSGVEIRTKSIEEVAPSAVDTLIIAGGESDGVRIAVKDAQLEQWVRHCRQSTRRFGAVCSGSFVLAHWGLLEGHRATTHWSVTASMKRHFPGTTVESESLYVQDGKIWTSGGVTSGIDMCLAMVEEDLGRWVTARVAKQLVLSARRLGNQSQYSILLETRSAHYAALIEWIRAHLCEPLSVQRLSEQVGESPRTFHRRFTDEIGLTPASFVEQLRLQVARNRLEAGESVKSAARTAGFTSEEHLARVFRRQFDMTPSQYRAVHSR